MNTSSDELRPRQIVEKPQKKPAVGQGPGMRRGLSIAAIALSTTVAVLAIGTSSHGKTRSIAATLDEEANAEKFDREKFPDINDATLTADLIGQRELSDETITTILRRASELDPDIFQYLKKSDHQLLAIPKLNKTKWTGKHNFKKQDAKSTQALVSSPTPPDDQQTLIRYLMEFAVTEEVKTTMRDTAIKSGGLNSDLVLYITDPQQQIDVIRNMAKQSEYLSCETVASLYKAALNDDVKAEITKTVLNFEESDFLPFQDVLNEKDQIDFIAKLNVSASEARADQIKATRHLLIARTYDFADDTAYDYLIERSVSPKVKKAIDKKWGIQSSAP